MGAVESFWLYLGRSTPMLFGRESASAMVWMLCVLSARFLLLLFRVDSLVPVALLFASPFILQTLALTFDFIHQAHPLLTIRVAESVLGRVSPTKLAIVIPAHFLGCLFATVSFYTLCPINYDKVLEPIHGTPEPMTALSVLKDVMLTAVYVLVTLALPVVFQFNRIPRFWYGIITLPLLLASGNSFHPAAEFALWYVRHSGSHVMEVISHMMSTLLGGIVGGIIMNYAFPDDASSWIRS